MAGGANKNARVLVAQGGEEQAADTARRLTALGYDACAHVCCPRLAAKEAKALRPDLALVDLGLGGGAGGLEAGKEIGRTLGIPVVYLTDGAGPELLEKAGETGPYGYVLSDAPDPQLNLNIQTALALRGRENGRRVERDRRLEEALTELQEKNRLMQTVFSSVSDGLVVTNARGEFLLTNPAAETITGMGATDTSPDEWSETYGTFYPDGSALFPARELPLARAMRGESVNNVELLIRNPERPQGVHISVDARPLTDESGSVTGGVIAFRDVSRDRETQTELRRTVSELEGQNRLMRAVFRYVGDGVVVTDEKGKVLIASRSAVDILGAKPPGARAGRRDWTPGFLLPDGSTPVPPGQLPIERALRGEDASPKLLFVRSPNKPDGVFISAHARPMRDASGAIQGAISVFRDVSRFMRAERRMKEAVEELRRQTHTMEVVFNSMSDGVLVADKDNRLFISNPSAHRIAGIPEDAEGADRLQPGSFFFPDKETPYPISELPLVRATRGEECDDVQLFVRNPQVPEGVFVSVSARPLRDPDGEVQGGVVVYRDITDQMQAEEALAQAFSQGRLEIVDTILHNIGNAINSVATGVGTIREGLTRNVLLARLTALAETMKAHQDNLAEYFQDNPQGQKAVPFLLALAEDFAGQHASLNKVARRVEGRVRHIVDIIRTQRTFGSVGMERKDVDLRQALNVPAIMLKESIEKRGIMLTIDCRDAPRTIRVQESRFNQMLVNLIKNAIEAIEELQRKSASNFKPLIRIRAQAREDFLVIDVIDNGIGIREERARRIFAAGYTTKERGSGLGLHSAANYVVGSGGKIYPRNPGKGEGTTMRVKLRLASLRPQAKNLGGGGGGYKWRSLTRHPGAPDGARGLVNRQRE